MSDSEKRKITVPESTKSVLERDARQFELFKKDSRTININRLLNLIVENYYNCYNDMLDKKMTLILEQMKEYHLNDHQAEELARAIISNVFLPQISKNKGKKKPFLSFKPTNATETIVKLIHSSAGGSESISSYYCKMLMSYCAMPIYEREKIVFKKNHDIITEAIVNKRGISFSTIWNEALHTVVPYALQVGKDEMFNYLICAELNGNNEIIETRSYRLNRIKDPKKGSRFAVIDDRTKERLERMKLYGAQYAINDDETTGVRLTIKGQKLYNRIYFGRPQIERIDNDIYYFNCSKTQLEYYFRRFGKEAMILYPESLKQDIAEFYKDAYEAYCEEEDNE